MCPVASRSRGFLVGVHREPLSIPLIVTKHFAFFLQKGILLSSPFSFFSSHIGGRGWCLLTVPAYPVPGFPRAAQDRERPPWVDLYIPESPICAVDPWAGQQFSGTESKKMT